MILDDLKSIHQKDAQDALDIVGKQWRQLKHKFSIEDQLSNRGVENIIVAGMGGSALAANILKSWPGLSLPMEIIRDYQLPEYVGHKTLFIASSYSGNTEETLSALDQAEQKDCQITVITSGGKLAERAKARSIPVYQLPSGFQPRMAVLYNLAALVQMLQPPGFIAKDSTMKLEEVSWWLENEAKKLSVEIPTEQNSAKKIALELVGSSVVIYSGPKLYPAAYKWKINFNENAKNIAWCNQLPEFNHNEFLGWTSHPIDKPYKVVELRGSCEHTRIQKRFEITEKLLSGKRPSPEIVKAKGDDLLRQLLWTIQLGDFVSVYLALLNGLNPTPVKLIERLKQELKG